ncbi:MAG: dethiobiotin synthase [Candidatus Thioglobus sp.]|nr:dethiobiotin synthase [Candidatus Thioglobus pontius]MBL6976589.1 dethiobiotin synthase [Candidatus Thioglobus sp.]MBL6984192.1 dethiobiotin synthase [Candidatus Thioglobus sp.]
MKGLFISGSGTDVGKTFIATKLIRLLAQTRQVAVRKPVESDCQLVGKKLVTKDAAALLEASNVDEDINTVCAYQFSQCCSAEQASIASGVDLGLRQLVDVCASDHYVVVEGAGGLLSPIALNTLNIDLAVALDLPVVIVLKDELGAVNQALLTLKVATQYQLTVVGIVLNQFKSNTLNNAEVIEHYGGCKVVIYNGNNPGDFELSLQKLLV